MTTPQPRATRRPSGVHPTLLLCFLGLLAAPPRSATAQTYRLTLGDAARLAAERSAVVLQAEARIDGAEARVRQARSDLLPHADLGVAWGARTFNTASFGLDFPAAPGEPPLFDPDGEVVGPVRSADLRAHLEMPLVDVSAFARRRSAGAGVDAVRRDGEVAADRAAEAAARAYLSVLRSRAEVVAQAEDLALARDLVEIARGQVEAGVGVALDVTRAEAQAATVRAQLVSARHHAESAELSLRRTLRLPADAELMYQDDLETPPAGVAVQEEAAVREALARRSDVGRARAYRNAAGEALSVTRAGRLPTLSAAMDDGFYGRRFDGLLNTYSWSLSVRVPVFDGLWRSARTDEQEAEIRALDYRLEDMEEEVAFQVSDALLELDGARELAEASDERRRLAERELEQEEERLRAGVAGTADVVRAAMRLNQARTARLDALWGIHAARLALASAMGTITDLP